MRILKIKKGEESSIISSFTNRTEGDLNKIDSEVVQIINKVRSEGDQGLYHFNMLFDGVSAETLNSELRVSNHEIESAYLTIDNVVRDALIKAAAKIYDFHLKQLEKTWTFEEGNGAILGQLIRPIENVGIYVPGGKAAYPSTVLMNVIPAKIAKVKRIVLVTPPQKDGSINPYVLAAAKIAGVDEIYKVGGAQAIAALAYGTESIKAVDKITGPGNIYVARAKKLVFGVVAIDMIAGPSEICIIADEKANADFIAADLLSQAEHDEMAASVLITTSRELAEEVFEKVAEQLLQLERESIAMMSIHNNGIIFLAEDIDSCFAISNYFAPEHLEIMLDYPISYLENVENAGAIFLGSYSPEPLGDYYAGPNHTLPTGGTARFASPLGVYDFIKKSSIIYYPEEVLYNEKDRIMAIADKEGLTAHSRAIGIRFESSKGAGHEQMLGGKGADYEQ